jgi:hypothetical protein
LGQTLTASPGTWSGSTPISYTYQWQRCDSTGGKCAAVSGATGVTYVVSSADAGSTLRVSVTATNSVGSATAASAPTNAAPTATSSTYPASVVPTLGYMRLTGSDCSTLGSPNQWSVGICGNSNADLTFLTSTSAPVKLVYMNPIAAVNNTTYVTFGVTFQEAKANGWLATDVNGNYLRATGYDFYLPLLGNAGFQDRFISNVEGLLALHPGVGVYYDNVDYDYHNVYGSANAVQYPTNADYRAALKAFLLRVNQRLQQNGYSVSCNARAYWKSDPAGSDTGSLTKSWWNYLTYPTTNGWRPGRSVCDKLQIEYFQQVPHQATPVRVSGVANNYTMQWDNWQSLIPLAHSLGATFGATETPDGTSEDARIARYARASLLLEWGGGYDDIEWRSSTSLPTDPSFSYNLGAPAGAATTPQTNVSKRVFEHGFVVVNHSSSTVTQDGYAIASGDARIVKTS